MWRPTITRVAKIVKAGHYDPNNLSSVTFHFGSKGDDAPILASIEAAEDPNVCDHYEFTALHRAAQFDRPAIVRALLIAGADPNRANKWGMTPLMQVKSGDTARQLLDAGADVDAVTTPNKTGILAGRTSLMYAAMLGNIEVAAILLEHRADWRVRDESGCNALMLAAWGEHSDMVQRLLDSGVTVGLVESALLGDLDTARSYLAPGADAHSPELATALRWAAAAGHAEVIALLLDHGVPIDAADGHGQTALMHAAQHGRIPAARLLLERGANANTTDHGGATALMHCLQSSKRSACEVAELLLTHRALANIRCRKGWTPLMLACLWGHIRSVELLLHSGADPNALTDAEITAKEEGCSNTNALMLAVGNGHLEAVKLLIANGGDPLAVNSAGLNALQAAQQGVQRGHKLAELQQILAYLEAALQEPQ